MINIMTTRRAALRSKNIRTGYSTYHNFNEHCDFCVLSFQTRPELKAHLLTHFKKKICVKTQKTLLLIGDDWFELHVNIGCTSERCDSEIISNALHIDELCVKKEENFEENDGALLANETSSERMKIESESETEVNVNMDYDFNASSSESWSLSSIDKRSRKTKVSTTSSPTTQKTVPSKTKKKKKKNNGKSLATEVTHTKSRKKSKCRICGWRFAQEELIMHLQSRHVPKIESIPTCETCGKTFSTPGNLRSHQYLHAERGRYICSYCGKEFVRNANLKEHINLHTGARPFVCEICKKTFHRETLLRNHRRIHTGEKKYRCNIENCERAYMFDIDLKRHKFSAHGIYSKKHPCFICSKVFSENKLLKKHLEAH